MRPFFNLIRKRFPALLPLERSAARWWRRSHDLRTLYFTGFAVAVVMCFPAGGPLPADGTDGRVEATTLTEVPCPWCNGRGHFKSHDQRWFRPVFVEQRCEVCEGTKVRKIEELHFLPRPESDLLVKR